MIEVDDRDAVSQQARRMRASRTSLSYAPPMHLQPVYAEMGMSDGLVPGHGDSPARG